MTFKLGFFFCVIRFIPIPPVRIITASNIWYHLNLSPFTTTPKTTVVMVAIPLREDAEYAWIVRIFRKQSNSQHTENTYRLNWTDVDNGSYYKKSIRKKGSLILYLFKPPCTVRLITARGANKKYCQIRLTNTEKSGIITKVVHYIYNYIFSPFGSASCRSEGSSVQIRRNHHYRNWSLAKGS